MFGLGRVFIQLACTVNQTDVMRWNYGDPTLGTCKETVEGGNHFRYWVQDGPTGNSGAIFLATSYELPVARACIPYRDTILALILSIAEDHDIINNG